MNKIVFDKKDFLDFEKLKYVKIKAMLKRAFDILFSLFAIVFFSPFFIGIMVWIKVKSPNHPYGKIFFIQERLGLHGKKFQVFKFRTMVLDAEEKLKEMLESDDEINNYYLEYRKLKNDPRIIKGVGTFLRKTSLDELPQFFNVLFGEMSVVGPRPYIEEEFYKHDCKCLDIILSVKPGVTGLWQIGDRSETTFDKRVLSDVNYILNQSFFQDIKIIFQTILVVVFKKGV